MSESNAQRNTGDENKTERESIHGTCSARYIISDWRNLRGKWGGVKSGVKDKVEATSGFCGSTIVLFNA